MKTKFSLCVFVLALLALAAGLCPASAANTTNVIFADDFETGLSGWTTTAGSPLTISPSGTNVVPLPSGAFSAEMGSSLNRMHRNLGGEVPAPALATWWIYDPGAASPATRIFNEIRGYLGGSGLPNGGTVASGSLTHLLAAGKYNTVTLPGEVFSAVKYQGRVSFSTNGNFYWLNLNASGSPNRSTGWHRFDIHRTASDSVDFYVDGILSRSVSSVNVDTWDTVILGSGLGNTVGTGWIDGVSVAAITITPDLPEIAVQHPAGTDLVDGAATLGFGRVSIAASSNLTFIVTNSGNGNLILTNITKNGSHPSDFTISALGSTNLAPAASTTFTVTFTPLGLGARSAAVHIANNDSDENSFDIELAGTGNTLPIAGMDSYSRGPGTSLKIKIANLITNDSDPDLEAIAITAFNLTTTNGVTLTTNATTIFYTNSLNVNDKFTYILTDAQGGSVTGSVLIQVVQSVSSNTMVSLQVGVPGANTNTLTFAGIPDYQYLVLFATNLTDSPWFQLTTGTAGSNGLWTVIDDTATNAQRYYKVATP